MQGRPLTMLPVYFWTRALAGPRRALAAAALIPILPAFGLVPTIMAENVYLPACTLALWLGWRAITLPTASRRLLAGLAAGLAFHTKPHALVIPLIFAVAILTVELDRRRLRDYLLAVARHWLTAAGWAIAMLPRVAAVFLIERPAGGFNLAALSGYYAAQGFADVPMRWEIFFPALAGDAGNVIIACGLFPAWIFLRSLPGLWPARLPRPERALLALACAAVAGLILLAARQLGLSGEPPFAIERYTMAALPPLIVLFCAALGRWPGARLGPRAPFLLAIGALALVGATQFGGLIWNVPGNAPSLSILLLLAVAPRDLQPYFPLLLYLLAGAGLLLGMLAGRSLRRGAAATALLLFVCLAGHYLAYHRIVEPIQHEELRRSRRIDKFIPPGERLLILTAGIGDREVYILDTRNDGRILAWPEQHINWATSRWQPGPDGAIGNPFPGEPTWLVASTKVKFNRPPAELYDNRLALYPLDAAPPLAIIGLGADQE